MEDEMVSAIIGPLAEGISHAVFGGNNIASVEMTIPMFRGGRDLFFFFVAVFSNGTGMMFGRHRAGYADLHGLSEEEFDAVDGKMRVLGVRCKRTQTFSDTVRPTKTHNLEDLASTRLDLPLERYRLTVEDGGVEHSMWFQMFHTGIDSRFRCCGNRTL